MFKQLNMPDLFNTITQWLLAQALSENSMTDTLAGLGNRLVEGGVPLSRISLGRTVLHPTFGLTDMQWSSDTGQTELQEVPRSAITQALLLNNPFADLITGKYDRIEADLRDPDQVARYTIFEQFADNGITGYLAFARRFGREQHPFSRIADGFHGTSLSFSTKSKSGFSPEQATGLELLVPAICACSRIDSDRLLVNGVLSAYLGQVSCEKVLTGRVALGDGEKIDCVIFYSDLRSSLALSQSLDSQRYLDTVNAYFDCTATAVADHGGEVLKFIGDGVLAIFPFDDSTYTRQTLCAAALASAQDSFSRAARANSTRVAQELPPLEFGIALHVGEVIYGNVGTHNRLDFTATGPAVGLASRIEGLTRQLGRPLLATQDFANLCTIEGSVLPAQSVRGFDAPVDIVSYEA